MGLFDEAQTPQAERLGPPVKQLTELTLRVYGSEFDPKKNVVRLHAEAKTAFADGTTGAGVLVGFFVNGRRLTDVASDDYGLALLDGAVPAERFREGENELVVRVKGFAREVSQTFSVVKPRPVLEAPKPKPAPPPAEPAKSKFAFQTLAAEVSNGPAINAEARRLVEKEHDYEQAVEVLERLPSGLRDATLYQKASQLLTRMRELDQQLAEARRDGTPEDVCEVALQMAQLLPSNQGLAQLINSLPKPVSAITNSLGMKFVRVPFGWFVQGDTETGTRRARISRSFYLGVYPVTQAEYQRVMGTNPSYFSPSGGGRGQVSGKDTSRFPVEQVSWNDAQTFCVNLSQTQKELDAGRRYRLPTEAEWERACRAGTQTVYSCGDNLSTADANISNSLKRTCVVGSYKPNALGLYDMHGNVWEWCQDWHAAYDKQDAVDPKGPASGQARVLRGGAWDFDDGYARSAFRYNLAPDGRYSSFGFRVVCEWSVRT